jgi:hypothetical protein
MDISEMDISEMTSSNVSEMHRFSICPFPISLFSDKPPFLPAPNFVDILIAFKKLEKHFCFQLSIQRNLSTPGSVIFQQLVPVNPY